MTLNLYVVMIDMSKRVMTTQWLLQLKYEQKVLNILRKLYFT